MKVKEELWSLDDKKKDPEDLYYEELSAERLKVTELIKRLIDDKKVTDETIIQFGAKSSWLWIDKMKHYAKFSVFSDRSYSQAKSDLADLEKRLDEISNSIIPFSRQNMHNIAYIAEYTTKMLSTLEKMQETELLLRNAIKTVKAGKYDNRIVLEVYRSIQNHEAILIHIVGDENGKYWDYSEVLAEKEGRKTEE